MICYLCSYCAYAKRFYYRKKVLQSIDLLFYLFFVLSGLFSICSYLIKETSDLRFKGKKFYLQENNDEYGGHDLICFPRLHHKRLCTSCLVSHVDEIL